MIPFFGGTIANRLHIEPFGNMFFNAIKSTTCNKQDVLCIDFNEFLIWVFPTSFWWHIDNSPFQQLQQCLLYPFSRHVTCDGRVVAFASNLIDFVDKYNAFFSFALVVVGCLKKSSENTLHILSNITCLCQNSSIDYRQGNIEHFCYRFGDQCFPCSSFSNHQHITLLDFNVAFWLEQTFVMIVNGHRHHPFGIVLTNHIIIQK